jgi:4-aminobutyrate aminotransferase-like enzyme
LLCEALADHQRHVTGPRPADPDRQVGYQQLIDAFSDVRGGKLYYPYLGSGFGKGPLVELADGSVKYDMIGGIGVQHLGHSHPALVAAGLDAAIEDLVMQGNLQQNIETAALSRRLVNLACAQGAALRHCFLTSSGAMANENALKLLFQKKHPANRLLAFERCFAGRTLALAQLTDKPAFREGLPDTLHVDYVPFYHAERHDQSIAAAVASIRTHLSRHPRSHAAMVLELVQGEAGYHPGHRDFFSNIIAVLKQHDVPVLVDEIQTFGRTSQPFAFQHYELDSDVDVVTVGKMTQVCATLFTEAFVPRPGLISQTFTASTAALFAADVVLDALHRSESFGSRGRNMRMHERFASRLADIAQRRPGSIAGSFGIGAMIAFTPLDGSADSAKRLATRLFDRGVIAFVAGSGPTRLRFLPPVPVMTDEDVDAVCDLLEHALADVMAGS